MPCLQCSNSFGSSQYPSIFFKDTLIVLWKVQLLGIPAVGLRSREDLVSHSMCAKTSGNRVHTHATLRAKHKNTCAPGQIMMTYIQLIYKTMNRERMPLDKCLTQSKKLTIKSFDLRIKFCPTLLLYLSPQLVGLLHHVDIKWLNIHSSGNTWAAMRTTSSVQGIKL